MGNSGADEGHDRLADLRREPRPHLTERRQMSVHLGVIRAPCCIFAAQLRRRSQRLYVCRGFLVVRRHVANVYVDGSNPFTRFQRKTTPTPEVRVTRQVRRCGSGRETARCQDRAQRSRRPHHAETNPVLPSAQGLRPG